MTYSIVARDPVTGELGIAVQSHWFSVGSAVPWARAGVGVVATQSIPVPEHGPRLLDLLAKGTAPDAALASVLDGDEGARFRQTAVLDVQGRVAVHTGDGCIAHAGHEAGDGWSCQANIMESPEVWPAMAAAFTAADGALPERLLAAMRAAEERGGDVRGRQSAAMLVVSADPAQAARPTIELRVEDHPDPIDELSRLVVLQRAYTLAGEGDELTGLGDLAAAAERYDEALALAPDNGELLLFAGLGDLDDGDAQRGLERIRRAVALNPRLRELLVRLPEDVAPGAGRALEAL
jgi:uncharacterized Ntn-hydrolase superfamily protein